MCRPLPRYGIGPSRGNGGGLQGRCRQQVSVWALTQPSSSLAPLCGRLLKALTHFQLRPPPHPTPPSDPPKHTAYRSSSAAGCQAAVGLCMQMLGGEGVSARLKNTWCVCSKAPRSCPCACKCRCTAGDKPWNKSGGIAASPANTKGHLPDIFSKTGHRISVKFGKTLCTCSKHNNSDLQEKIALWFYPSSLQKYREWTAQLVVRVLLVVNRQGPFWHHTGISRTVFIF